MGFVAHCKELGIDLLDSDIKLIQWKMRMIPASVAKSVLEKYVEVYLDELEKCSPLNYARHSIARHYANRFLKLYRV